MSTISNYDFYLVQSRGAIENQNLQLAFHFRARRLANLNTPPFLIFDGSRANPVEHSSSVSGEVTNSTISVWLEETNVPPAGPENSLLRYENLFSKDNPPDYSRMNGQIRVFLNSAIDPDTTKDDVIHDQMDAEYPIEEH